MVQNVKSIFLAIFKQQPIRIITHAFLISCFLFSDSLILHYAKGLSLVQGHVRQADRSRIQKHKHKSRPANLTISLSLCLRVGSFGHFTFSL